MPMQEQLHHPGIGSANGAVDRCRASISDHVDIGSRYNESSHDVEMVHLANCDMNDCVARFIFRREVNPSIQESNDQRRVALTDRWEKGFTRKQRLVL